MQKKYEFICVYKKKAVYLQRKYREVDNIEQSIEITNIV